MSADAVARPIVIVGSGAAGVAAAWPLLEAGLAVTMIDPGVTRSTPSALDERTFPERRMTDGEQWRLFLGADASILENASPKLRAPEFTHVFRGFRERYRIVADHFAAHGSLAPGGLTNAWGSGVGAFTEEELRDYPVSRSELVGSYRAVAERIGVSGSCDDDLADWFGAEYALQPPHPLQPHVAPLYDRHNRRIAGRQGGARRRFRLGRPQQAVLTADLGDRKGCDLRAMCMYGCKRRAIYNAADEVAVLRGHPRFSYESGWFVTRVSADGAGFAVDAELTDGDAKRRFAADRVILAAGTLGSTKLALEFLGAGEIDVPLVTTPVLTFALLLPENLFAPPAESGYALGQLAFAMRLEGIEDEPEVFGGIFATTGLLPTEMYGRLPLLRPFGRSIGAWLWPRLLVGACFFPGRYSRNTLRLSNGALVLRGEYRESLNTAIAATVRGLRREFGRLGAALLPGTTKLSRPGEEMHYGATLPMRATPNRYETDREGRLSAVDGLHIVDGTVLTTLPAKSHTLTIMANADRIARLVAAKPSAVAGSA